MYLNDCEKAVCKMNRVRIAALIKGRDAWKEAFMDKEKKISKSLKERIKYLEETIERKNKILIDYRLRRR